MKKRLLSAFLAVMMVLTMAPVAFAAESSTAVAKIGDATYSTLADAVVNAKTGDTIVMMAATDISKTGLSIASGKDITLDLNGHEVKAANTQDGNIKVEGKLTLKDSTDTNANGEGEGKITTSSTYVPGLTDKVLVTALDGEFVMESGLIDAATNITDNKNNGQFAVGVENQNKNASVTINGGKIKAGWYAVAGNGNDTSYSGDITVNGGILESTADYAIYNPQKGTTTINGGVIYGEAGGISIKRGTLVVNDGTITSKGVGNTGSWGDGTGNLNNAAIQSKKRYDTVTVLVKGGKVIAEGDAVTIDTDAEHPATVAVTGGTFSSDISKYCEKNYYTEQNEDNTYTVKSLKDVAVAQIGDTYYKTLAEAYAALPRGNAAIPAKPTTIEVLKDSAGGGMGSDTDDYMNYVIDFGGHTYTVGAPAVGSTGTVSQGIRVLKTSTAKFMNGTLKAANYKDLIQVVHTYGDVTFQDFTVDATEDAYAWAAVESDAGTLKVLGNSSILARKGQYGLYAAFWHTGSYDGTTVDVDTTGKITGKLAYEFDEDYTGENKATENKGFVNIKNGNFDILSIQEIWSDVSDEVDKNVGGIIISGGYFTVDPTEYLVNGYVAATSDKSGYDYMVTKKTDTGSITVKPAVAEPEVNVSDKISESDKAKVEDAAKSVEVPTLGAAAGDKVAAISKTDAESLVAEAPNLQNPTLYVQTALKVEPTAYNAENKTLALEITPQYRVVASTATTADEIKLDKNAQVVQDYQPMNITKATVVTMELPADFASGVDKLSIQHTKSNGTVEYYTGTVTEQNGKHLLTFTTNGFSPFVISVPAASIGENVYPTLQAAVDSVESGKTIKLEQAVAPDTKVTVAKTIKFEVATNEKTFAKENIVAGANTTVKVTGDASPYTYEFTYTKPSSGGSSGGSSSGKTTYKVTTSAVNNGGVNASPSSAEKGAAITITLSPDKGYKLDKLTVTDGSGKTVSTVKKSDTVYTFTMPASAVKVGVSYVKATETPSETKFNDVSANDWFASAVDYVTGKGMMNGTADNTFSPKANTTRGMVVTVLYRLENQPSTSAASFTDVASGAYYANAVAWANANGIVSGYGSGKFGPNDKVTREQLAAILYRYAQYKKYDVSVGEDTNILSYNDAQSISSYAIPAIQWACGAGVVTGKSGSKLDPKGNATRAEVAAMLMRFCENVK